MIVFAAMNAVDLSKLPRCSVDWNDLKPIEGGRLCTKCNKCIVDFTAMPDREVAKIHLESKAPVCGVYRPDQYRVMHMEQQKKHMGWPFVLLGALTSTSAASAHVYPTNYIEQLSHITENKNIVPPLDSAGIQLAVSDAETGEPIPFASVVAYVDHTPIYQTTTDFDGYAFITFDSIPDSIAQFNIQVSMIGYLLNRLEGIERNDSISKSTVEIKLNEDSTIAFGVTVKKPTLWQRIKWKWYALWHKKE